MRKRIRIGNDIEVVWIVNIKDNAGNIADLSSFDLGVDLIVGTKVFNITNACTISGNTITFIYRGSEQIYTGSYVLKLYDATNTSVTYDIKTAFVLVDHSWRAPDVITVPTTVEQTSTVSVSQIIVQRGERGPQGPKGDKGDKGEGAYTLQAASSDELGGIKIGYAQNAKNYPVKLDESNRAFVTVPWVSGGGGGGGGDDDPSGGGSGGNGSYTEMAFKGVSSVGVPTLPENGVELDTTTGWAHSAPNNLDGTLTVWMTTRIVTASGTYNDWQGPWRISGAEGEAGVDGDYYEYIYARTTSESVQPSNPNSGVPDASSSTQTVTADDFIPLGWTDNPQGVTTAYQVEWMAMRLKQHTDANRGGTWSQFIGPVVWSKYGVNGTDGDGVEYIYYAGTQYPATEPSTWTSDDGFQNREYIRASAAGNISTPGSGWVDDPFDLTSGAVNYGGWKQWVCVRKKYIGTGEEEPSWHAYSDPALWSYVGQDGDAGIGVVADIDNDTMAVSLKSTGYNNEFSQTATVTLYNGAATVPSTVGTITVADNAGTDYTSEGWVTNSGNLITVELDEDEIDLSDKTLLVTIPLTGTVSSESVSRTVVLTIIGVHFGTDGASYRLVLDSPAIRKKKDNTLAPASITPLCVKTLGSEPQASYNNSQLPSGFTIKYSIDGGSEITLSSGNSISTTNITDSLRVELDYNNILVDQETIYILHDGADGRYVAAINEYYAVGTSKTISPSGWQLNTIPTYTLDAGEEKYLWNYEVTVFDDGSTYTSTAVVIAILNKSDGISKINNYYLAVATDVVDNSTRVPGGTVNDDGYVTSGVANIGYGWAKNDPSAIIAVVSADKRYMWNFEEIVFESGLHYVSKIHIADRYIVTDVEFIKKAFEAVVDNRNAATLTGYLGVVDSGNTNKIRAMINGSTLGADVGGHGKLLISSGFTDLDVNNGRDGTFRVYEDGYVHCENAHVEGQIEATSGYIGDLAIDQYGINASIQSGSDDYTDITINGNGIYYESYSYSGTHVPANKETWGYFSIGSKVSHPKSYVCVIDTQTSGIGGLWIEAGSQADNAISIITGDILLGGGCDIVGTDSTLSIGGINGGVSVMSSSGLSVNKKRTVIASSGGTLSLGNCQVNGYELDVYVDSNTTGITISVSNSAGITTLFGGTETEISTGSAALAAGYMYHLVYYSGVWYVSRSN